MTALRMRARNFMTDAELIEVRTRSTWKGGALIAHAWALILGAIALVVVWPNPLTYLLAVSCHRFAPARPRHPDARRRARLPVAQTRRSTCVLSQWFCAYPIFAETRAYRRYHLKHHARTQQDDDPDLVLSAPFPITRRATGASSSATSPARPATSSARRSCCNALGDRVLAAVAPARAFLAERSGRRCVANAALFAGWRWRACGGPIRCCGWCRC